MQLLRLGSRLAVCQSKRQLHVSAANMKALQNWKRPSIDEMLMPKEPWKRVYESNQKKYNMQLATGVVLLGGTILVAVNTIRPNATPDFLHSTGFVTKLPGKHKKSKLYQLVGLYK